MGKWKSNNSELVRILQYDQPENNLEYLMIKETDSKVIGLVGVSDSDCLTYNVSPRDEGLKILLNVRFHLAPPPFPIPLD